MKIFHRLKLLISKKSIALISILLSIVSFAIMHNSGNLDSKHYGIVLLPFAVFLGSFLLIFLRKKEFRVVSLSIYGMYVFRYIVVATVSVLGNYYIETSPTIYLNNFNPACLLMFFEYLFVVLVLCIDRKKSNRTSGLVRRTYILNNSSPSFLFALLLASLSLVVLMLLIFPSLKSNFFFFFKSTDLRVETKNQYATLSANVPGVILYPFVYLVEWIRITLPIVLTVFLLSNFKNRFVKVASIFTLLTLSILITTHVQITGFFVVAVILMYIMENNKHFKRIAWLPLVCAFVVVFILAMDHYSGLGSPERLARVLQNYFNGPSNVAAGFGMPRENSIKHFFIDFLYSNSFVSGVFGIDLDKTSTMAFFNYTRDETQSSIFPFVSQTNYYFGSVFAVAFSSIVALLGKRIENIAYSTTNLYLRVLLIFCGFKLGICMTMYFSYSVFAVIWDLLIPYSIIAFFGCAFRMKTRRFNYGQEFFYS